MKQNRMTYCLYSLLIQDIKTKCDLLRKRFRNKKKQCLIVHPDMNLVGHLIQSFENRFSKDLIRSKIY